MTQTKQRPVIVTGGSRGIGAEIVRLLAARKIPVCFNYTSRITEAQLLARELEEQGQAFCMVQADVSEPSSVLSLFEECDAKFGALGGLVNNAGFVGKAGRRIDTLDIDTLRKTFDINVIGPILCAQQALKRLSTKHGGGGGRIINVSSIESRTGSPNDWVDYAASKAALRETRRSAVSTAGPAMRMRVTVIAARGMSYPREVRTVKRSHARRFSAMGAPGEKAIASERPALKGQNHRLRRRP